MCAFLAATVAAITNLFPIPRPLAAPLKWSPARIADFRLMSIL